MSEAFVTGYQMNYIGLCTGLKLISNHSNVVCDAFFFLDSNTVDFCLKFKYKPFIKISRNVLDS